MKRNASIFWLFGMLVILFVSCQNTNTPTVTITPDTPIDWWNSWLSQPICQLPCWQNVTPGKTSMADAIEILENSQNVTITYKGKYGFDLKFLQTGSGSVVGSANGIVSTIRLGGSKETELPLQKVIDSYGSPSFIKPYDCREGMCATLLAYPDFGMLLDIFLRNRGTIDKLRIEILPDTVVHRVYCIESGMENFQKEIVFQDYDVLMEWKGYDEYPFIIETVPTP